MSADVAFEVGRLYEPLSSIASLFGLTAKDLFLHLPGIRAAWPMSVVNAAGDATDITGNDLDLGIVGSPTFGFDGNAYGQVGPGSDYWSAAPAGFDITGIETFIDTSIRGLTLGGWFMFDSAAGGTIRGVLTKEGTVPNRGYGIVQTGTDKISMRVSGTGASNVVVNSQAINLGQWYFIVGRYTPGSEVAIFVNADKTVNTTAVPASLFVNTINFEFGRWQNSAANVAHIKGRSMFITATSLPDEAIEQTFRTTRQADIFSLSGSILPQI